MAPAAPSLSSLASGLPAPILEKLGAALRAQEEFDVAVARAIALSEPGPWMRPQYVLANGWRDGAADRFIEFRSDGFKRARIQGRMTAGTISVAAFMLPPALCPSQRLRMPVTANGAFGDITIDPSGAVSLAAGSTTNVDINLAFACGG